jgi:5-methylcytosine-specific restriction endonuclease McrA
MADGDISGCRECGKPTKQFVSSGKFAAYCSKGCSRRANFRDYLSRNRERLNARARTRTRRVRPFSGVCLHCGREYTKATKYGKAGIYCSKSCACLASWAMGAHKPKPKPVDLSAKRIRLLKAIPRLLELNAAYYLARFGTCKCCGVMYWREVKGSHFCSDEHKESSRRACRRLNPTRKAHKKKRRALARGACGSELFVSAEIFERDRWTCRSCACSTPKHLIGSNHDDEPTLDHVIPLARGGAHTRANAQTLCRVCNVLKNAMTMDEFDTWRQGARNEGGAGRVSFGAD